MSISEVRTGIYRIALDRELTDSRHGLMTHFAVVLVRIRDREGREGLGYTYTIDVGATAVKAMIEDDIAPWITGEDETQIERLWEMMWWRLHYVGRGGIASFAISAVDLALWDLLGKRRGEPLWRMLGGYDPRVIPYAGGIDLMLPMDRLLTQTRENISRGFKAVKMKVGREDFAQDVERVAAVRREIGPEVRLMVDANMQWSTATAVRAAKAMALHDITWFEEPTIPDDYQAHARIESEGGIPVAAGENLHTIYEFRHMIEIGRISFPEPDVSNCGGITGWMRVARLAYAHNLPVTTHGVHEIHLHLLAAIPNRSFLEVHGFGLENYMKDPPQMVDGAMTAPSKPGHGVEFDEERLSRWRV